MDGITVNSPDDGLPYILNFSVPGIRSETMLHHLAQHGVYVSSGSACARGHKSHVLEAMKLSDDRIDSAIRVSFGHQNTEEDVLQLTDALQEGLATLTRRRER
jgi:cysteine desulfurase